MARRRQPDAEGLGGDLVLGEDGRDLDKMDPQNWRALMVPLLEARVLRLLTGETCENLPSVCGDARSHS